ncbi:MAG: IPT/TIG domain-containing protein [Dehalococcoidales bacterium]|nr:IPT/TIG domain-containing protein [Dehalococcoidales bacterium]
MKITKIFPVLAAAGVLALLIAAVPAGPALAANSISLDPEQGQIGDRIDIDSTGWPPSYPWVDVYFTSEEASPNDRLDDDIRVYHKVGDSIETDSDGSLSSSFEVPARLADGDDDEDVVGGTYYVCVTLQNSKQIKAVAEFTITAGQITISPKSGKVGTEVDIDGEDFAAEEGITIYYDGDELDGDYIAGGDDETDNSGEFTATIIIPPGTAGKHTILVTDESISNAEAEFTVDPSLEVSPTHALPGDAAEVSGTGFDSDENVTITIDGEEIATEETDSEGSFTTTFTVPELDEGVYDIEADDGSNTVELEFTVDSGTAPLSIDSIKPAVPAPLLPADGGKAAARAKFDWGDVTDQSLPVTYSLQVASDAAFNTIVIEVSGLTASEYTLPEGSSLPKTSEGSPYYWRVRATDAAANVGDWSAAKSFHVGGFSLPGAGGSWLIHLWWGLGTTGVAFLGFRLGKRRGYYY